MSSVASWPRIACVASSAAAARAAQADLAARYELVDPGDCEVIVALGGDGLLLHTIHEHLQLGRPIFGMNRGTVGFLTNQYRPDGLLERVAAATPITIHPLRMAAPTRSTRPSGRYWFMRKPTVPRFMPKIGRPSRRCSWIVCRSRPSPPRATMTSQSPGSASS
jgi:hypothetical protein